MSRQAFRFGNAGALLRHFVDQAAVPTFLTDLGGQFVYANRACGELFGCAPEELVGRDFSTLVHQEDLPRTREQREQLAKGQVDSYEAERRYIRKNGELVWVLASAARLPGSNGGPDYLAIQAVNIDRRKKAETAAAASERRWNFALESAGQGVWETDLVKGTSFYSPMWKRIRGYDPDEVVDSSEEAILARVHPDDRARVMDIVRRKNAGEMHKQAFEYREMHRDGHYIWISSNSAPEAWDAQGRPTKFIGTDTDITNRKQTEERARGLAHRLQATLEVSGIGVFEGNLLTGELFWDDRIFEIFGIERRDGALHAVDWENALHPEDAPEARAGLARALVDKATFNQRYRIVRPSGEVRTIMAHATYYEDANGTPWFVGANWDITAEVAMAEGLHAAKVQAEAHTAELEAAKARIENQSLHDALTGLPNRRYLDEFLNKLADGDLIGQDGVALLHVDLDRFKQINDTLGHVAGDAMLKHVAKLLQGLAGLANFVARIGGDEFMIVCPNTIDSTRLALLADRIIAAIRRPVPYEGHFCRFGASIGIAVGSTAHFDARRVLINSDIALYRAKGRGRNRHEFFSKALQDEIESTKRLADDVLRGTEQREFLPFYQPLFDARTLEIVGVEALVRWRHPTEGLLTPYRFLKVAEDLNVLAAIDRDILEQSIEDLRRWKTMGLPIPKVSVNVSFRRLSDDQLIPSLRALDIDRGTISFEFLESIFFDEFDESLAWNIDAIKEMGIGIDVDDFGTGHTSFISLLKLNPGCFKIDRQLIEPIARIPEQRRLVGSIIDIGKTLGIAVVAEGVETLEQAAILRDLGCDRLQGYAFAQPMPAAELEAWVRAEAWRKAS